METTAAVIQQRVESWMLDTIRTGGYRTFADLHIDQIHPSFAAKEVWIYGSLRCLEIALLTRNRHGWRLVVAVGMSLKSGKVPRGINFATPEELTAELDPSPPSLYMFEESNCPWVSAPAFRELDDRFRLSGNLPTQGFFHEWWDDNDAEFRRAVWIAG